MEQEATDPPAYVPPHTVPVATAPVVAAPVAYPPTVAPVAYAPATVPYVQQQPPPPPAAGPTIVVNQSASSSNQQQQQQQQQQEQILSGRQLLRKGLCPTCKIGQLKNHFTLKGICWAVILFPIGLICCYLWRKKKCNSCGEVYG
ncbi:uncharacterized protein LOC120341544 isoform X1 [Styela clava]